MCGVCQKKYFFFFTERQYKNDVKQILRLIYYLEANNRNPICNLCEILFNKKRIITL